jgi:hypothetical protein
MLIGKIGTVLHKTQVEMKPRRLLLWKEKRIEHETGFMHVKGVANTMFENIFVRKCRVLVK